MLFDPISAGEEWHSVESIQQITRDSIESCHSDLKKELYQSVILSGGVSSI